MLSFCVVEKPFPEMPGEAKENPTKKREEKTNNPGPLMTDAQKRYLFRILADQGKEGEAAHEYLKKHFQVTSLQEVAKAEASDAIEHLLKGSKGGAVR
jgi:hypothetical protein